jgi:hypothetical protein
MITQLEGIKPSTEGTASARTILHLKAILRLLAGLLPLALSFGLLVWFLRTVILERGESTYWWEPGPRVAGKALQGGANTAVPGLVDIDHHAFWLVTFLAVCLTILVLASLFVLLKTLDHDDS